MSSRLQNCSNNKLIHQRKTYSKRDASYQQIIFSSHQSDCVISQVTAGTPGMRETAGTRVTAARRNEMV